MDVPANILLIDKPKGITSFDVIRRLRTKTGIRKYGHAGTLDPAASGLIILGVNDGTKRLTEYLKLPKEYIADILVGERRTTGDMDGEVMETSAVPHIDDHVLDEALAGMIGTLTLPVSAYSAIKRDGIPMYKRVRAAAASGEAITDLPIRDMDVMAAERLSTAYENEKLVVRVRFFVGSGTYIRSLAEAFGRRLGYPATLKDLRRTKIGEFRVEDAASI
jgi:tRNA pseudouridine55 synthase